MAMEKGAFPPVKFFVSVIYHDMDNLSQVKATISQHIGNIDSQSESFPFDLTDYYNSEMGSPLFRTFLSLKQMGQADQIVPVKQECLSLERAFTVDGQRTINIDPGYIDMYKLVLVSEKYMGHKIYLGHGICADLVLLLGKKRVTPFQWTFPDFKSGIYTPYLLDLRRLYLNQLKVLSHNPENIDPQNHTWLL